MVTELSTLFPLLPKPPKAVISNSAFLLPVEGVCSPPVLADLAVTVVALVLIVLPLAVALQ
jgi:hypothetical protein